MKYLVLGLSIVSLTACGLIADRSNFYRDVEVIPRTRTPQDVEVSSIQDLYPVPDAVKPRPAEGRYEVPQPESIVARNETEVRAFRSGNQYWLSTRDGPAETWAKVRRFWELNSIGLATEIAHLGVMETEWLSRDADGQATQDRFRLRVEHGMRENSAEVYIMHLGYPQGATLPAVEDLDWSEVKENDDLAVAIMQEIATYLIETEYEGGSASLLAQSFSGSPKSSVVTDEQGNRVLMLKLNYDRAWDVVGKAIEDARMEVSDRDRSAGSYYVSYYPNRRSGDDKPGFFSFLRLGSNPEDEGYAYLIKLQQKSEQIEVSVLATDDKTGAQSDPAEQTDIAEKVLLTIRENLI